MSLGVPTDRQLAVLMFIIGYRRRTGMSPTLREIMEKFDIKHINVAWGYLNRLQAARLIRRDSGIARSIVPTARFIPASELENSNGGDLAAGE